jgi:hypothetical protein
LNVDLAEARWQKASYSGTSGCIEVAHVDGHVALRDSKDRQGPVLVFTPMEWRAFIEGVRDGEFDRL